MHGAFIAFIVVMQIFLHKNYYNHSIELDSKIE